MPDRWTHSDEERERIPTRHQAAHDNVSDLAELRGQRQRRRNAVSEAVAATRARAAGSSREEIREINIAERRARNLTVPEEPALDAVVDHITTGDPLPAFRVLGESLLRTGKGFHDPSRPHDRGAKGGQADGR